MVEAHDDQKNVVLGIAVPSYGPGHVSGGALLKLSQSKRLKGVAFFEMTGSILTASFNTCWCWGLNARKAGLTHFLLMHADIKPENMDPPWIDIMLGEMEKAQADVLSAIVPIKDARGVTSTALDTNKWHPVRITQKQAKTLPVTWTCDQLLTNTGLMLVDFRKPWVEKVCFHINDEIYADENGEWKPSCEPEDWNFARQCHALGLRVFATRAVEINHFGAHVWNSKNEWGWDIDEQNTAKSEFLITGVDGSMQMVRFENPKKEVANGAQES
jgi:hypothetical protein